jgi:hypothetical protein
MIQSRSSPGLQKKPIERRLIASQLRRKKFERHAAAEGQVLGFIDNSHTPATELAGDAVMRDGLSDHDKQTTWVQVRITQTQTACSDFFVISAPRLATSE